MPKIAILFTLILSFSAFADSQISISQGLQREFYSKDHIIIRAAMGDPEVATLNILTNKKLLISGKSVGKTTLLLWYKNQPAPERHSIIVSPSEISLSNIQVQTDIKVVEVSKTKLKEAGFFFGKNTANTTIGIGSGSSIGGITNGDLFSNGGFLPLSDAFQVIIGDASKGALGAISALNSNGFAYTLAEPSLVTMSGHSATFLAGGEFPFPKSSNDGEISIEFREFGVRLQLSPTVLENERILLKVAPEVSELNYNQGVSTSGVVVPGISVRRTDTTVQLGNGESFIISGLISHSTMKNSERFPGLGDLPIIGAFFRANSFEQSDKELMMIVTPHIVRPLAKDAKLPSLPGELYHQFDPSFFELIFLNLSPEDRPQGIGFSEGL